MITEAILVLIKTIAIFIINLMPSFPNLASWANSSITPLMDVIISANYFIDLRVTSGCLITVVIFSNIEFIWSGVMWIVRKIPGVS